MKKLALALLPALTLSACVQPHKIAASVVTAPFKVVGGTVDMLTTSQKEADLKRGRALRKQEEREKKYAKKAKKQAKKDAKKNADDWD